MVIKARNLLDLTAPKSYLVKSASVGNGTVYVYNINDFSANDAIQVGRTGGEKSEVVVVGTASPAGTEAIITGTTRFDHPVDTPVYVIGYDKMVFKRSTTGTAGTASAIADGTVDITPDSEYTQFDDTSGATTYAYKASYYNSVTTDSSSDSDWLEGTGFSFYSLANIRERVKDKLYDSKYITQDSVIDNWINEWLEEMNNVAVDVNKDYNMGTASVAFSSSGLGTITSSDFKEVRRLEVTWNGSNYYRANKFNVTDFDPDETFANTAPYYYWQGDNVFGVKPDDNGAGTALIWYYKTPTVLDSDADELPVSMRAYTKSFVDYAVGEAYLKDNKVKEGDRYNQRALMQREQFRTQLDRSKSTPQYIKMREPIEGDESYDSLY